MDILAVVLACSLYPDDELIRVLAQIQSNDNILFVGDLSTLETNDHLGSREEALRTALAIERRGGVPAVGLLGVPLEWASRFGRERGELFDACTNVAVASATFVEYAEQCSSGASLRAEGHRKSLRHRHRPMAAVQSRRRRECVLEQFGHALGLQGAPKVVLEAIEMRRRRKIGEEIPAETSPIFELVPGGEGTGDPVQTSAGPR